MKYELVLSGRFKKGLKVAKRRGLDIALLDSVVDKLLQGIPLDEKYKDHPSKGKWDGFRECHIHYCRRQRNYPRYAENHAAEKRRISIFRRYRRLNAPLQIRYTG